MDVIVTFWGNSISLHINAIVPLNSKLSILYICKIVLIAPINYNYKDVHRIVHSANICPIIYRKLLAVTVYDGPSNK